MILYAQTSGTLKTNSSAWAAIPGLQFELPEGVGLLALLILNVPNPYAQGNDFPGGNFAIAVNGTVQPPFACFTYDSASPQSTGRKPTTLVVAVPLIDGKQKVQAMWSNVRGSTVIIDSPATLSAVS
ncbi:MAG: hypothetical protein ACHQRJ_17465 [Alphaproteobacteria bacterium]